MASDDYADIDWEIVMLKMNTFVIYFFLRKKTILGRGRKIQESNICKAPFCPYLIL